MILMTIMAINNLRFSVSDNKLVSFWSAQATEDQGRRRRKREDVCQAKEEGGGVRENSSPSVIMAFPFSSAHTAQSES